MPGAGLVSRHPAHAPGLEREGDCVSGCGCGCGRVGVSAVACVNSGQIKTLHQNYFPFPTNPSPSRPNKKTKNKRSAKRPGDLGGCPKPRSSGEGLAPATHPSPSEHFTPKHGLIINPGAPLRLCQPTPFPLPHPISSPTMPPPPAGRRRARALGATGRSWPPPSAAGSRATGIRRLSGRHFRCQSLSWPALPPTL